MKTAASPSRRALVVWCPGWPAGSGWFPGSEWPAGSGPLAYPGSPAALDPASGPGIRAFEQVVSTVEEFCPRVEVLCPGACAIAACGPARYFGGEDELARRIADEVNLRGFDCRVGIADGLFAARLAARAAPSGAVVTPGGTAAFLASYPVAELEDPELADLLPRLGITTIGEFAALPAAEVVNRFGARGARAYRLASGLDPRPLVPRPPSVDLSGQLEFDPPVQQSEPVVFAAKALADQMHSRLAARGLACVRVQVQAVWADGRECTRLWRHDGLLSSLAVAERVRWQLDGWRSGQAGQAGQDAWAEASGSAETGGIGLLRLTPDQLVRDEGRQLGLWGDAVISDRVARAAVRVQAMLGHDAVTRPVLAGGRGLAEQVTLAPFGDIAAPPLPAGRPWPGKIPAPAPATVYPVAWPVRITDDSGEAVTVTGRAQVSGFPARLSAAGRPSLAVTSWAGPWPVTERWWDPASARRQARFQLVTEDGSAWLAVVQDGRWQIEASYD